MDTEKYNGILLGKLSDYLNFSACAVTKNDVAAVMQNGASEKEAYDLLLATYMGLDILDNPADKELFHAYFADMTAKLNYNEYAENAYLKNIKIPSKKDRSWEFRTESYKAYEAFVYDDFKMTQDGRVIPQIGFFDREYRYPAVLQNGREWMLITPNEINTMKDVIDASHGNVLTYGLGLGYFAYMASQKEQVQSVTVVERDDSVVKLFEKYVLPQFSFKEKIKIIEGDAFEYAKSDEVSGNYDVVFTDLWHDAADGIDAYRKMKALHSGRAGKRFYWIEKTMKYYLG